MAALRHLNPAPTAPSRVVVIGARGFVGNAIATRLERDGVSALRVTRREVDLLAPDAASCLAAMLRANDAVVAAAALAPCKNPEMLRDNVTLAAAMAAAVARVDVAHFVNIGSDAVYADSREPLSETSPVCGDTLHGVMHLAREAIFRSAIAAPSIHLRPTLIYGPGDPHNGYGPNRFRRLAAQGERIVLFGEGEERRDHVFIDDVADLAARVLCRRSVGVLNLATGVVASFRAIAEAVVRLSGGSSRIEGRPRVGPMPHNGYRAFDIAACRAAFPDFSFTSLDSGLALAQQREAQQHGRN